jgi:hypothetical protein
MIPMTRQIEVPGKNAMLRWVRSGQIDRVLEVRPDHNAVIVFDCTQPPEKSRCWPVLVSMQELKTSLASGELVVMEEDAFMARPPAESPRRDQASPQQLARDAAWETLQPLIRGNDAVLQFLDIKNRSRFISRVCEEIRLCKAQATGAGNNVTGPSQTTIRRLLRAYWRYGQVPNALTPRYGERGRKGKTVQPEWKKLGRPAKLIKERPELVGINLVGSKTDKKSSYGKTHLGVKRHRMKGKKSWAKAYDYTIRDFYSIELTDEFGKTRRVPLPANERPTLEQFKRVGRDFFKGDPKDVERAMRMFYTDRTFDTTYRDQTGHIERTAHGPGDTYEIDATPWPIQVVRKSDRSKLIGTVTVFIVRDRYTHMYVGCAVVLERENYLGYALALENAASNKAEFLKRLGIDMTWECEGMPTNIYADRGPFRSASADNLVNAFGINITNTRAYIPNLRPLIESSNAQLQLWMNHMKGTLKDRIRGKHDGRFDGIFDIDQLTEALVRVMLYTNEWQEIKDYSFDADMIADTEMSNVAYPTDLWGWGLVNRKSFLTLWPQDYLTLHLLPGGEATVTPRGLYFKPPNGTMSGRFYDCQRGRQEGWFRDAKQRERQVRGRRSEIKRVSVAYHPYRMGAVYLRQSGQSTIEPCHLMDLKDPWKDFGWAEYEDWQVQAQLERVDNTDSRLEDAFEVMDSLDAMTSTADELASGDRAGKSRRNLMSKKSENREDEIAERRLDQNQNLVLTTSVPTKKPLAVNYVGKRKYTKELKKAKNSEEDL